MKKDLLKHNRFLRLTGVTFIILFGIMTTLGSGGGGDDVVVDEPSNTYLYVLSGPRGGTAPLTASATLGEDSISVIVTPTLEGTYDSSNDTYTISVISQAFEPAVTCNIVAETSGLGFGNITGTITAVWRWVGDNDPTQGAFQVNSTALPDDTVTVSVISTPIVGVSLTDGIDTVNLTWEQFNNWWEEPTNPLWQRIASFAYNVRGLLFDQITFLGEAYVSIQDNKSILETEQDHTVEGTCSTPLPDGVSWNNSVSILWVDEGMDGTIDFDETVNLAMNECWFDKPFDDIDKLLSGSMTLLNYTPGLQSCPRFDPLLVSETENGMILPDSGYQLTGGYCFLMVNQ